MPRQDEFDDDLSRRADDERRERPRRRDEESELPPRPKSKSPALVIVLVVGLCLVVCGTPICIGLLLPAVQSVRQAANRMKSTNNLKQIGLAIHNYNDTQNELPANTYDANGKPLLSWRVHILPYVEHDALYRQFKLDEPWDGPNNIRLLNQMPRIYQLPQEPPGNKTYYRGFTNPGAVFARRAGRDVNGLPLGGPGRKIEPFNLSSLQDPPDLIILVVEAGEAVEWTKPDDLDASPGKPLPPLEGKWRGKRMHALFADGSVRLIRSDLPESTLRALITHSGSEVVPAGWDE
jgi:prepilin-type processing-associated H-X9-DG protein